MKLQEQLQMTKFEKEELDLIKKRKRKLLKQLAFLTRAYEFLKKMETLKPTRPDDLHRELFEKTDFRINAFRYRVGIVAVSSTKLFQLLNKYEFDLPLKSTVSEISKLELDEELLNEICTVETKKEPLFKLAQQFKRYSSDARDLVVEKGLEILKEASEILRDLGRWYELSLAESGIIKSERYGTPLVSVLVGAATIATAGMGLIKHDLGKTPKEMQSILNGFGWIGAAIAATAVL